MGREVLRKSERHPLSLSSTLPAGESIYGSLALLEVKAPCLCPLGERSTTPAQIRVNPQNGIQSQKKSPQSNKAFVEFFASWIVSFPAICQGREVSKFHFMVMGQQEGISVSSYFAEIVWLFALTVDLFE